MNIAGTITGRFSSSQPNTTEMARALVHIAGNRSIEIAMAGGIAIAEPDKELLKTLLEHNIPFKFIERELKCLTLSIWYNKQ